MIKTENKNMLEYAAKIVGSEYCSQFNEALLNDIKKKDIVLEREPSHLFDKNAIKCVVDGIHIGYIERFVAAKMSLRLEHAESYKVHFSGLDWMNVVVRIVPGSEDPAINEIQRRLVTSNLRKEVSDLLSTLLIICRAGDFEKAKDIIDTLEKIEISSWHYLSYGEHVYLATKANKIELVVLLVEAGFKYNDEMYRALRYAIQNNRKEIIDYFLRQDISKAGRAYALIEAYRVNNKELIKKLSSEDFDYKVMSSWTVELVKANDQEKLCKLVEYAKSSGYFFNALLEAAISDQVAELSLLLSLPFKESQLGRALTDASAHGAKLAVSILLDHISTDVIVEAALSIAIDHEKNDVFTVLVSKSSYSKRLEMLFIQVIKKGKADMALSLYEMGAYKDQPKKMANELLDATVFNEQVKNFTFRKIFDLLPKYFFIEKISEIKTKKQLSSLFACSSVDPLEVSLLVGSNELRDACIDMFKLYKTQLYKKRAASDVELIQSLLVNSDIPGSIVKKLAKYHIENEFDLSMYASEEVLRNLVGLQRVEINEILYFLEDRSFELQASDLLVEFDAYIEDLELSTRTKKLLIAEGLVTIRELVQLTESDLRMVPGLGNKSFEEITMILKINNLSLDGDPL